MDRSGNTRGFIESYLYQYTPVREKPEGSWLYRKSTDEYFYDCEIHTEKQTKDKYGDKVTYLEQGTEIKRTEWNPDEGFIGEIESYTLLSGEDDKGIVIDIKGNIVGSRHPKNISLPKGGTIMATGDDCVAPSTLHRNYFGSVYIGPDNSKYYGSGRAPSDRDNYDYTPTSPNDWAAYWHDLGYDVYGAKGLPDALFGTSVLGEDLKLVFRATGTMLDYRNSTKDQNEAFAIATAFGSISTIKISLSVIQGPRFPQKKATQIKPSNNTLTMPPRN